MKERTNKKGGRTRKWRLASVADLIGVNKEALMVWAT